MVLPNAQPDRGQGRISVLFPYRQEKSTERLRKVLVFPTEFGRRDWTRTNDPHHVKVVLLHSSKLYKTQCYWHIFGILKFSQAQSNIFER